jgi:AcrR family transcriptional regulator
MLVGVVSAGFTLRVTKNTWTTLIARIDDGRLTMASASNFESRREHGTPDTSGSTAGGDDGTVEPRERAASTEGGRKTEGVQKHDDERSRLLKAAMDVLERTGWWGFKVESVLRQANLSTRSFYRHFDKKSDLLLALLEVELGGAAVSLRRSTAAAETPSDKVRAYLAATIDMAYRADLAKPSSLFASHWRVLLPEYPDAIDRCTERLIAPLVEAITEGRARGEFLSEDPVAEARAVFFLVAGMTADQATLGGVTPREELEHIVLPFVTRAIGLR